MNIKFQIFLMISLVSTACLPNTYAEDLTQVLHFNSEKKGWDKNNIANIAEVSEIITAGKYAWAYNEEKATVAFYDGSNWSGAIKISGMKRLTILRPGYPVTGKQSIVWATGKDSEGYLVTAYFDGKAWTAATRINGEKLRGGEDFEASSGYAWVSCYDQTYHIKMSNSQNPNKWIETNLPPLSDNPANEAFVLSRSFNDEIPFFYALFQSMSSHVFNLIRIDSTGKGVIIQKNIPSTSNGRFIVRNSDVLISIDNNSYFYTHDNGNIWKVMTTEAGPVPLADNNYFNGILCAGENGFSNPRTTLTKLGCIDNYANNPVVKEFDVSKYGVHGYLNVANNSGIWLSMRSSSPFVLHFDVNTAQLIDTNVSTITDKNFNELRSIGINELLACGYNKKLEPSAFYYDGKTWSNSSLQNSGNCHFSTVGDFSSTLDKNIWIYFNDVDY